MVANLFSFILQFVLDEVYVYVVGLRMLLYLRAGVVGTLIRWCRNEWGYLLLLLFQS